MIEPDSRPIAFAGCLTSSTPAPQAGQLALVGLPDDSQSSFLRGPAEGPCSIRSEYDGRCYNSVTELGVDLAGLVFDGGDWPSGASFEETRNNYRERASALFERGVIPFFAGGDHAVTIPIGEALTALGKPVHVVQIDAHPDLYPELDGSPRSHACVAARLLEMNHIASVTQYGIRTLNRIQQAVADRHGRLTMFHARELMGELPAPPPIDEHSAVYVSVDLDGIDPAFAPGVSHPVPGGLSSRQVLNLLQSLPGKLVGMDVVELNPSRDHGGNTAVLAARLLHEGMGVATAH
jgi:agmatinase